jgi:hypothetical protein
LEGTSNVIIGYQAGQGYGATVMNSTFAVQVGVANPCLLSGTFGAENLQKLGVNLNPNENKAGILHVRFSKRNPTVNPSAASSHMILEGNASMGITLLSAANATGSGLWMNDGTSTSPQGGITYNHSTARMAIRCNLVTAITFGQGFLQVPGLPTSATGLASGQIWNDVANGNVLKVAA